LNGDLDDFRDRDFRALEGSATPDGGRWSTSWVFFVGVVFLAVCGWQLIEAWRSTGPSPIHFFNPGLGILLGAVCIYWQWRPLMLLRRTVRPLGELSPGEVRMGDEFTFRYRQAVRQPFRAEVTVSLVLRETIVRQSGDGETTRNERDHLVATHTEGEREFPAGGFLRMQCRFRVPDELEDFLVTSWPVKCLVKVHVQAARGADFWEEFMLPVSLDAPAPRETRPATQLGCQVTLVNFPNLYRELPPPSPLQELLPHLTRVDRLPLVLRRGVSRAEAEAVCRALEAAGGVVELRQGDRVIDRARVHDLPLPAETVAPKPESLPLPASETEASIQSGASRHTNEDVVSARIRLQ
jgi:hypothetical protein